MQWIDRTYETPADNLACDEVLLGECEAGREGELLRFWEPSTYFVVLGYSNFAAREANLAACHTQGVPVLRRGTGGGTVLQGPGCLCYSLFLRINTQETANITRTNTFVMERQQAALQALLSTPVERQGDTDLALGGRKFSGNAQQRKQKFLLFHGTLLLSFDLQRIEELLVMPSREPQYRHHRSHTNFLTNLHLPAAQAKAALRRAWSTHSELREIDDTAVTQLARTKYQSEAWNFKR